MYDCGCVLSTGPCDLFKGRPVGVISYFPADVNYNEREREWNFIVFTNLLFAFFTFLSFSLSLFLCMTWMVHLMQLLRQVFVL